MWGVDLGGSRLNSQLDIPVTKHENILYHLWWFMLRLPFKINYFVATVEILEYHPFKATSNVSLGV